jgi:hypothetical protein
MQVVLTSLPLARPVGERCHQRKVPLMRREVKLSNKPSMKVWTPQLPLHRTAAAWERSGDGAGPEIRW